MDLAVIIVSYNVRALLASCLRSLQASLVACGCEAEVLVVDNASSDGSAAMVRAEFPAVRLLEPGANLGFARGNNEALRTLGFGHRGAAAERPFAVWLLNPDTEVVADTPARLLAHLRANPRIGAVGPSLRYGDGRFQHAAFAFPGLFQIVFDLFPGHPRLLESSLNGRYARAAYTAGCPFAVDMLLGAALMVRGEAVAQVGLLDEHYFMYAEELDWCRRLKRAGWAVKVVPAAVVVHHEGQSTRQFREAMFVALWRSRLRYYQKFERPVYVAVVRWLLRLGMAWQTRQARAGAARGTVDPAQLERRLAAYAEVAAL
ncbi:MAG: glycosyltransferase family 2 protein [Ardenticatenaceae bacterium]|nr:glycosyltransferase family 2 protein [Ardenticatenaceae bacterium]